LAGQETGKFSRRLLGACLALLPCAGSVWLLLPHDPLDIVQVAAAGACGAAPLWMAQSWTRKIALQWLWFAILCLRFAPQASQEGGLARTDPETAQDRSELFFSPQALPSEPLAKTGEDLVALPYEQSGGALSLPLTAIGGDGEEREFWMVFDTGATLTTLNERSLEQLGISVPEDAPSVTFRTAKGMMESRLVVLPMVWLGGYEVGAITVAVCEACGSGELSGLLGLNISEGFLVTLDPARQELLLQPRDQRGRRDIRYWVKLSSRWVGTDLTISVHNRSERSISDLQIGIDCRSGIRFVFDEVPPGETTTLRRSIDLDGCEGGSLEVLGGRW
jgi:hypothetical protein